MKNTCLNGFKAIAIITLLSLFVAAVNSCKSKQKVTDTTNSSVTKPVASTSVQATNNSESTTPTASSAKTIGKVSHQYRADGCSTVVIVIKGETAITLIPIEKLPEAFDVDGLEISFTYHTLKIQQPKGCTKGIPASFKDIAKK